MGRRAAVVVLVLIVASALALARLQVDTDTVPRTGPSAAGPSASGPSPSDADPSPSATRPEAGPGTATPVDDGQLFVDVDAAEAVGAEGLLAAGRLWRFDARWSGPASPVPAAEVADERPVYVADVRIGEQRSSVTYDIVIAFRPTREINVLPLRLASTLVEFRDTGGANAAHITRDGEPIRVGDDQTVGLLLGQLDPVVPAGEAILVRVRGNYDLPTVAALKEASEPWGVDPPFLARSGEAALLAGWIPQLDLSVEGAGTPEEFGGGQAPPGVWSVRIHGGGQVITGAVDAPCPGQDECVWARANNLPSLVAVATEPLDVQQRESGALDLRIHTRPEEAEAAAETADLAAVSTTIFQERLGELPWEQVDFIPAAIQDLEVIGVSFPGLVLLDTVTIAEGISEERLYLVAHEAGHQWFGALVDSPGYVVPESLAQYLAFIALADHFGEESGQIFVDILETMHQEDVVDAGEGDEAPSDPNIDIEFDVYLALVYGRAALAWTEADEQLGRDAVLVFLRHLVERHHYGVVDDETLIEESTASDPDLGAIIERYWMEREPIE